MMPSTSDRAHRLWARASGHRPRLTVAPPRFAGCCRSVARRYQAAVFLQLLCASAIALAAESSPVGAWKTIDDQTGQVRAIVRIAEVNGEYQGQIENIFPQPGEDPSPRCEACSGARRDRPLLGMVIIENIRKRDREYSGGTILDPETGTTYRCSLALADAGRKLLVRGFVGFSLFGRTQTWLRNEP